MRAISAASRAAAEIRRPSDSELCGCAVTSLGAARYRNEILHTTSFGYASSRKDTAKFAETILTVRESHISVMGRMTLLAFVIVVLIL